MFVPVPVPSLRRTLSDPARVARCVPGLQQDVHASAASLSGRLKVRVGSHTITYRGALRFTVSPQDGPGAPTGAGSPSAPEESRRGDLVVEGEGVEVRGGGSAKLVLTIALTERDGGTAIGFAGTARGDGRILDLDPAAARNTAVRLLDRFAQQLVTETLAADEAGGVGAARAADAAPDRPEDGTSDGPEPADGSESVDGPTPVGGPDSADRLDSADGPEAGTGSGTLGDIGDINDATLDEAERSVGEAVEQAIEEAAEEADTTGAASARRAAPDATGGDDADGAGTSGGDGVGGVDDDTPPTHEAAPDEAPSAEKPPGTGSVFHVPVPPSSLDPEADAEADLEAGLEADAEMEAEAEAEAEAEMEFTVPDGPPAEAAHARRTMIGRSAEEVDHAPPRGRYAPVPSPESTTAGATLRWVAPAAALALASAVVVGRALRRRR
ncbi:hypothetical protein [Streptomyces sp. NPDC056061]|uniref:hypothetical protein n=1 Tax=Streptomyces sp. NPDC056061 TaxID=3345700 RepID=UPI0035DF0494